MRRGPPLTGESIEVTILSPRMENAEGKIRKMNDEELAAYVAAEMKRNADNCRRDGGE